MRREWCVCVFMCASAIETDRNSVLEKPMPSSMQPAAIRVPPVSMTYLTGQPARDVPHTILHVACVG